MRHNFKIMATHKFKKLSEWMTISRKFFWEKGEHWEGAENIISFKIKTRRKKALTHNIRYKKVQLSNNSSLCCFSCIFKNVSLVGVCSLFRWLTGGIFSAVWFFCTSLFVQVSSSRVWRVSVEVWFSASNGETRNSNLDLGGEQILVGHGRGVLRARVVRSSLHPDGKLTLLPAGLLVG